MAFRGAAAFPVFFKYGGDAIWAMMVFSGFGFLFPRLSRAGLALAALGFAWGIEFSQIYQAEWINSIRATRPGHLVLGSTFNWPDLPAYLAGVCLGVALEALAGGWLWISRAEGDPIKP